MQSDLSLFLALCAKVSTGDCKAEWDCMDVWAGFSLHWVNVSNVTFSHVWLMSELAAKIGSVQKIVW